MSGRRPLLEALGMTKIYPGATALDDVDFSLKAGRGPRAMGENGAGKSGLVRTLFGS